MARGKGLFQVTANYEPLVTGPFDARMLVQYKEDLILPDTWTINGSRYIYNGMIVAVANDADENNGLYRLKDRRYYTDYNYWEKLAELSDIIDLQAQIDELKKNDDSTSKIELEFATRFNFPNIGVVGNLYIATDENATYYWDDANAIYKCIGRDYNEIETIFGGHA